MPVISKNTAVVSKYVSVVCPGDCGGTCGSCPSGSLDAASVDYLSELQIRIPDPADISTGGDVSLKADKIIGGTPDNLLVVAPDGENFADSGIPITNVAQVDSDGIVGNLTVLDANKNAVDAGYAASPSPVASSVVQRQSTGQIKNDISSGAATDAIRGSSVAGRGIYGTSDNVAGVEGYSASGPGLTGSSVAGTYAIEAKNGATQVSGIRRTNGILEFVGASAVANRAAQRTELGLGSAALLTAGATGTSLVEAASVDAARAVLLLPTVSQPPRLLDHMQFTNWAAENLVGTGAASITSASRFSLDSGVTPSSTAGLRGGSLITLGYSANWVDWSKKQIFYGRINYNNVDAAGKLRLIFGKDSTAFGTPASGNYVAIEALGSNLTSAYVCNNGTLTTVTLTTTSISSGGDFCIISENGTVNIYESGVLIGTTTAGPVLADRVGAIVFEIENVSARHRAQVWTQSVSHH